MKKVLKRIPYKHRLTLTLLMFVMIPYILVEIAYFQIVQPQWKRNVCAPYQNMTDSDALALSEFFHGLQQKIEYIQNSYSVRRSITQMNKLSLVQELDFIAALEEIESAITADNADLQLRWYPCRSNKSYGRYCYTLDLFIQEFPLAEEDPDYKQIAALSEGEILWKVRTISRKINNKGNPEKNLCLYTQMVGINGADCIVEFSIPIAKLLQKGSADLPLDSIYLVRLSLADENEYLLSDTTMEAEATEKILEQLKNNQVLTGYEVLHSSVNSMEETEFIYILAKAYITRELRPQILTFLLVSLIIVSMLISISYLTSYLLTKRIILMIDTMNTDLQYMFQDESEFTSSVDDMEQISFRVRELIHKTQEYCVKVERYEAEKLRMELELLQMRFNPHLLYNTMSAIRYQVKNPEVRRSIDSLCHYYRIILNNGNLIIRLQDEMEMIKEYLEIEKFAYHLEEFSYEFEINDTVKQYPIIKHLLQPIVENALKHGIRSEKSGRRGLLKIRAEVENDQICIWIIDNGAGMQQEVMDKLLLPPQTTPDSGHGYGIYNVQQRIKVYYGTAYGLELKSEIGKGTVVTVRLPIQMPKGTE